LLKQPVEGVSGRFLSRQPADTPLLFLGKS
jgi:hypothetical protein